MVRTRIGAVALAVAAAAALSADMAVAQPTEFNIVTSKRVIWGADLAYDSVHAKYLVVWVTEEAVFGQFVEPAGGKSGEQFIIDKGAGHYFPQTAFGWPEPPPPPPGAPAAAPTEGKFLVTYAISAGKNMGIDYRARFVTFVPDAAPTIDPEIVVDRKVRFTQPGAVAFMPAPVAGDEYFLMAYPKGKGTVAAKMFYDGTTGQPNVVTPTNAYCGLNVPDLVVASDATGTENVALVTGWRDPTSVECKGQSGIWYRFLDSTGAPAGPVEFAVQRGGLSREQKAAYNPKLRRYVLEWSQRKKGVVQGIIFGRRFDIAAPVDEAPYEIQGPVKGDAEFGNDGFGQAGIAFDPVGDEFVMAMRGADKGGPAPIFQKVLDAQGIPIPGLEKPTPNTSTAPWPLVVPDGQGHLLTIFRGFYRIQGIVNASKLRAPQP